MGLISTLMNTVERQMSETLKTDGTDPSEALPPTYEGAVAELESIVQAMEGSGLSLEASLAAYRRGAALAVHCRELLAAVQQQVSVLEADLLRPFDTDPGDAQ